MLKPTGRAMFTVYLGGHRKTDQAGGDLYRVRHTGEFLRESIAHAGLRMEKARPAQGREFADQTAVLVERT